MRRLHLLLLTVWSLGARVAEGGDALGPLLRALADDDRERRREALDALASGRVRPETRREGERIERALARLLSDTVPGGERALATIGLGRLERPGAFLAIASRLRTEEDDRVLDAAADSFRVAAPEALFRMLRDLDLERDPLRRAIYVRMVGMTSDPEARARVRVRAAAETDWCPRAAAALALGHDPAPEVLPILVSMLDAADPGVVAAAVEALTRLTGQRHAADLPAWKAWWSTRDRLPPAESAEPPPAPKPDARRYAHEVDDGEVVPPYYFGIPVRGRKVVFVCDVSASMRYKLPLANDQLARAIKGLSSHVRFEVIFFNEFVWPWRGRLSRADPATKELLVRHLPTIEIKSYTNLFDSLERAFELDPDELFVISDGEPNRGRRRLPRDILNETDRLNRRHVPVHTVSVVRVVDGDEHLSFLKELATRNGGEHVARTLK